MAIHVKAAQRAVVMLAAVFMKVHQACHAYGKHKKDDCCNGKATPYVVDRFHATKLIKNRIISNLFFKGVANKLDE